MVVMIVEGGRSPVVLVLIVVVAIATCRDAGRGGSITVVAAAIVRVVVIAVAVIVFVAQSLSRVRLSAIPSTAAPRASLSFTISQSLLKLMSIESVRPCNHLILCRPLLFLPSIFPRIRLFSDELALRIRWPQYWGFSFSISPSNEYSGSISFSSLSRVILISMYPEANAVIWRDRKGLSSQCLPH